MKTKTILVVLLAITLLIACNSDNDDQNKEQDKFDSIPSELLKNSDKFIAENFDCFELKDVNSTGAIYPENHKNLKLYEKNELSYFSIAASQYFVNYYPDAMPLFDYYPFSAFISEDKNLVVLLFCEYYVSEKTNNFIVQTVYDKKPTATFSISEVFGLENIEEFENLVTITDGFSGEDPKRSFRISIFKTPKGTTDDYGTIQISTKGNISLFTGSGVP